MVRLDKNKVIFSSFSYERQKRSLSYVDLNFFYYVVNVLWTRSEGHSG